MGKSIFGAMLFLFTTLANIALAQQTVWIQIEAQKSLTRAQSVARSYAGDLQQVNGFAMRTGWYAIAIGPFSPTDAQDVLQQLRITRQIPADSYIADGSNFTTRFWPIGTSELATQAPVEEPVTQPQDSRPVIISSETPAQARRSEKLLTRPERELIQIALQWEGHYTSAIDGAFGPGTRKSMAAWQRQQSYEETGVLTSLQRNDLVTSYQKMLTSLGMVSQVDTETGIRIDLPLALIKFDRYDPPFAHFAPLNNSGVQVLLISQTGDEATLRGLYDILQTLEIVPLEGARKFRKNSFTLTGQNSDISSYTYAALADGHVKGFTVIWPAGADKRRKFVINGMQSSFSALRDTVLPDVYGDPDAAQSLDLLAGLSIRKPDISRSGFYVDAGGAVLTTLQAVSACERVTLDDTYDATVSAVDPASGLALLQPSDRLAPLNVARILTGTPRLNSEIAVSGYSYEGVLGAPTLTFGTLADLSGLAGETGVNRLALSTTNGDAGGPVLSTTGAVIGMLLPHQNSSGQRLPAGVNFSASSGTIAAFLNAQGVTPWPVENSDYMAPEDLTLLASDMTVLVSCWN